MSRPDDRPESPAPRPPGRRGLAALFAAFMEEHNILWGELVGGLLVIGCSTALVISLWHTLGENPLFKFATFTGAVSAVYGAGLYTLRRWKLEATSRGLLLMALLLTPLVELALTSGDGGRLALPTQVAALLVLGAFAWRAARVLAPDGPWLLAAVVVLTSACQLPVARMVEPGVGAMRFAVLGLLPAACLVVVTAAFLWQLSAAALDNRRSVSVFVFLGVGSFSLLVVFGFAVFLHGDVAAALGRLALPAAVAGLAPLAGGAFVHRGLADYVGELSLVEEGEDEGREGRWASARTGGTTVALAGIVVMLLAVGLAWPRPQTVLAVCVLDFVAFTAVAFRFGLPIAHAVALPCVTGAYLMVWFLSRGLLQVPDDEIPARMLELMEAPATSTVILVLFALCGAVSELLARWVAGEHGKFYALGSAGIALLSLGLVTPHGLEEPARALVVYAATGAGALLLNLRWRRAEATYAGIVLLTGATLWALWWAYGRVAPPWGAVLAVEALGLGTLAARLRGRRDAPTSGTVPLFSPDLLTRISTLLALGAVGVAGWTIHEGLTEVAGNPWVLAHVFTATCLSVLASVRAVTEGRGDLARLGGWLAPVALIAAAGWVAEMLHLAEPVVLLAAAAALSSLLLAVASARVLDRPATGEGTTGGTWARVLAPAWAESAIVAGLLALVLVVQAPDARPQSATLAGIAVSALLLAWALRKTEFTWLGSVLLLVAIAQLLLRGILPVEVPHALVVVFLAHATLVLIVSLSLKRLVLATPQPGEADRPKQLQRLLIEPLGFSATLSSLLAIPAIVTSVGGQMGMLSLWTLWLAGLWLVVSCLNRRPELFAAFQAALSVAVLFAVAAWLETHAPELPLPRALQVYGIGLAVLSLFWVVARIRVQSVPTAEALLSPSWPAVDRVVFAGLVVAQLGVAVVGILPGLADELIPNTFSSIVELPDREWVLSTTDLPAWALLALLAIALTIEVRVRLRVPLVLGLLVLALTVPVLTAGRFAEQRAVASALRWGAGLVLLVCSLPIWLRHRLTPSPLPLSPTVGERGRGEGAERLGLRGDPGPDLAVQARRLLVLGTVVPVIALTLTPVWVAYNGGQSPGPAPGSVFLTMGRLTASVGPLFMVCVGLIVHALRERLPGYAFVVGLGGNLMVSLIVRGLHRTEPLAGWYVQLLQVNAVVFAATALLWLAARRRLYGESGSGSLLVLQLGLAVFANALLLVGALGQLLLDPADSPLAVIQSGETWGWIALATAAGACAWYTGALSRSALVHVAGTTALAVGVLLACTTAGWSNRPWLAYHVLTVVWPLTGVTMLGAGWLAASRARSESGTGGFTEYLGSGAWAPGWVSVIGAMVLGLALRGVAGDPAAPWWPAGVVLLVAGLAASLGLWQRKEMWAFTAGLGVLLSVSLVVEHFHRGQTPGTWWVLLVQAGSIAAALVALAWLAVARRLYGGVTPAPQAAPLLALQTALSLVGNAALLFGPLTLLVLEPGAPPAQVGQAGGPLGWVALLLAAVAAVAYAGRALAPARLHVLCGLGLAVTVLAACSVARSDSSPWLAYHVLTIGCALLGAATLITSRAASHRQEGLARLFPRELVQGWVAGLGVLVLALALRGIADDPVAPWWPAGMSVAVGALWAGLAVWQRSEGWAVAAGLCVNVAVTLILGHGRSLDELLAGWVPLVQANVITSAAVALLWLVAGRRLLGRHWPQLARTPGLSGQVALGLAGNLLLLVHPAVLLILQPGSFPETVRQAGSVAGWVALLAAVVPAVWYAGPRLFHRAVPILSGLSVALGVLVACTAARWDGGNWLAYHVLIVAWCIAAAATLFAARFSLRQRAESEPAAFPLVASVVAVGVLVLGLALRGVVEDPVAPWWSAGPLLFVAGLAAGLALWRRRETWAFVSGLLVLLAVSLVVEHGHRGERFDSWWVVLVQANAIAAALVALGWLGVGRRLYGEIRPSPVVAPQLAIQAALPLAGTAALLLGPLALLVRYPASPPEQVVQAGGPLGWVALLLAAGVAAWYAGRALAPMGTHLLCALGLAASVLVACTAARWDRGTWLAYHVLTTAVALVGAGILAGSGLARRATREPVGSDPVPWWTSATVIFVAALALRGVLDDPARPWWPAGALLASSGLSAVLAVRQRREVWAFAAGVGVNLAASLVTWAVYQGLPLSDWWYVLVQVNVISAALAACAWLAAAPRIYGSDRPGLVAAPLLSVQVFLGLIGNAALLLEPVLRLIVQPGDPHPHVLAAGEAAGWLALLASGVAVAWHLRLWARRTDPVGACVASLAVGILVACTVAHSETGGWLAYHALMTAWSLAGFVVLLLGWFGLRREERVEPVPGSAAARIPWRVGLAVSAAGLLVLGLAGRALIGHPSSSWWAAGAVLALSIQAGLLAAWQRRESWAFVATQGIELTVALLMLQPERLANLGEWWIRILQVNILSSCVATMIWLAAGRRLYRERPEGVAGAPLLTVQVLIALLGTAVLLVNPALLGLLGSPGELPDSVAEADGIWGWLTLLAATLVTIGHVWLTRMQGGIHVVGSQGMAVGIMAACTAAYWDTGQWLAYHVLMTGWLLLGTVMLAVSWAGSHRGEEVVAGRVPRVWVPLAGIPVLALAVRAVLADPTGAWWAAGAVVGVSALAALQGLWQRSERWAFAAGLGVNLAVSLVVWRDNHNVPFRDWWVPLLQANVLASSLVALVWLVAARRFYGTGSQAPAASLLMLQVGLAVLGNLVLLAEPGLRLIVQPSPVVALVRQAGTPMGWLALLLATAAAAWYTWRWLVGAGVSLACGAVLALGVMAACTTARWDTGDWLAYHVLTLGCALAGLTALAAGWLSVRRAVTAETTPTAPLVVQAWVWTIGALVSGLAVRGAVADVGSAWWSAGPLLSVSAMAGLLALWQRREIGVFAAALGVNAAVSLVLWRAHQHEPIDDWWVRLVQANIIASSVAALAWLAARGLFYDEQTLQEGRAPLRGVQVLLGLAGNALLLAGPAILLVAQPDTLAPSVRQAGGVQGWLTLGLAAVPAAWHFGRRLAPAVAHLVGGTGLAVGVLGACTAAASDHGGWLAYHALLVGWAVVGLMILAGGRALSERSRFPASTVQRWGIVFGALVLGLALRGIADDPGAPWWPAGAVLSASAMAAGLALWQRREAWAFLGGLGVNLAVSLVLVSLHQDTPFEGWWLLLVQGNVIAGAAVALAWLAAANGIYGQSGRGLGEAPLLTLQVALTLAGNFALLAPSLLSLVSQPAPLLPAVRQAGDVPGWLALLGALAAACWHAGRVLTRWGTHLVCVLGLGAGVLVACSVARFDGGDWLSYHTLTAAWAIVGLITLTLGWRESRREPGVNVVADPGEGDVRSPLLALRARAAWAAWIAGLVLLLGLRGVADDPGSPWWPAAAFLTASVTAAGLAVWQRRESWAFVAALGVNGAVSLVTWHFHRAAPFYWWVLLVQVNIAASSACALLWLAAWRRLYAGEREVRAPLLNVQVLLGLAGNALLLLGPAWDLVHEPGELSPAVLQAGTLRGWLVLLLALAPAAWHLGRSLAREAVHILCGLAVGVSVLAACTAGARTENAWLAYHVLTAGVALTGLVVLGGGWLLERRSLRAATLACASGSAVQEWVVALGTLTLALALRGAADDPGGPWWSAGAILSAGGLAALLAVWQRREVWAFMAGLCVNLAVSLLLWMSGKALPLEQGWVLLVQANVIVLGAAALVWLAAGRLIYGQPIRGLDTAPLLTVQVGLGLLGNAILLLVPFAWLVAQPGELSVGVRQAGGLLGWLGVLFVLAAAVRLAGGTLTRRDISVACALALALGVLAACTASPWDDGRWQSYHVLLLAWSLIGLAVVVAGWVATDRALAARLGQGQETVPQRLAAAALVQGWGVGIGAAVVGLAVRGVFEDPTGLWWSTGGLLAVVVLTGALAVWARRQELVYVSGLLLTGTALMVAISRGVDAPLTLLHVGLLSLASVAAVWSALEGVLRRRTPPISLRNNMVPFAHAATMLPLIVVFGLAVAGAGSAWLGTEPLPRSPLPWATLAAVVVALVTCLWDATARFTLAGMYVAGVTALALWLAESPAALRWSAPILALFVTLTMAWWRAVREQQWLRDSLGVSERPHGWPTIWFPPAQALLTMLVIGLSLWLCLTGESAVTRLRGPLSIALLMPAALLFAGAMPSAAASSLAPRSLAQYAVLLLGTLLLAELSWAWLDPAVESPWLQRSGLLMSTCSLLTLFYGVGLARRLPESSGWPARSRHATIALGTLTLVLLTAVLGQEALLTREGTRAPAIPAVMIAVGASLVVLMGTAICFAVLPGLDPLRLSERGRTGYVYAAELLLVLLFAHLRLGAPARFSGRLSEHWTFVVLGVAFLGAGLSEFFDRLNLRVLAEPLRRTGLFLPMLPVLAFWVRPAGSYAALWFGVGLFYSLLSVTRRSLALALLAAGAVNVGLWAVLHENQVAFLRYPQLWVVPFALTVLVAAHLNRDRLGRRQLATLRYVALTVIYVSSTAETFLAGLGEDVLRPLVLVALSVLGVFAGMMLRVRAFLFLGSGFVGLGVFALVWHAAKHKAWLWYVAGIFLGIAIIALFAVFEKRRTQIVQLLERLREWDS